MFDIIVIIAALFAAHECGHLVPALFFGHVLRFRFALGRFCVPRLVWDMPEEAESEDRLLIAVCGFAYEFIAACGLTCCFGLMPLWVFAVHFLLYPYYAGEYSDFDLIESR